MMRVALMTFTRDRLAYSRHCFASLEQNAGCDYDHWVLDQASEDGTPEWLGEWRKQGNNRDGFFCTRNLGICAAANYVIGQLHIRGLLDKYDVIVRYDNDCEVTQPDTLKTVATLAHEYGAIIAPHVNGLNHPPPTIRTAKLGDHLVDETRILGGIFLAIPAFLFHEIGFRYDEHSPLAMGDEAIVPWWRGRGGVCGYLQGWSVNHYETSEGQKARYPDYEQRKILELAGVPPQMHDVFKGNVSVQDKGYDSSRDVLSVIQDAAEAARSRRDKTPST